jgi:3-hydroxyisobutyrate dehydrogenase
MVKGTAVAFVGLGNMGGPMAENLMKAGIGVIGFDVSERACAAARENGAFIAGSAREAAAGADIVITMLTSGEQVLGVWPEALSSVNPGAILIDCSTIDVASARQAHALARRRDCLSLDAPVSGGTAGARAATLTFMAGGSSAAFARAEPILTKMGSRVLHCGDDGAGQIAKICNNMILGVSMIVVSEAFVLAERLGLSQQALFEVASNSSGQCWSLTKYCPVPGPVPASPANNGYRPGFSADLMLKDLRLAQQAALSAGAATPLGAHAAQLYALFERLGHGGDDFSAIVRMLRGDVEKPEQQA